jgi:hypothetical protein
MNMAQELYKSDTYVEQQRSTLEQILGSMGGQANLPIVDDSQINVEDTSAIEIQDIEIE